MPDYNDSQIYKIVSPNHEKVYYGSTTQTLEKRFSVHLTLNCSSTEIINAGGADIKHIEWFPCDNKHALEDREAYFILNNRDGCVNKYVPGAMRRAGGKKAYMKLPEAKAQEKTRRQTPEYKAYQQIPEVKERKKALNKTPEYRKKKKAHQQTPEYKASEKARQQTPEYKAKTKAYQQTPIQCACGKWSTFGNIKRHQRTNTCKTIIEAEVAATMNDMLDQLCVIES